jgi:hypothetical protein
LDAILRFHQKFAPAAEGLVVLHPEQNATLGSQPWILKRQPGGGQVDQAA